MNAYTQILEHMEALYPHASPELLAASARSLAADYLRENRGAQIIDLDYRRKLRKEARCVQL